MDFAAEFVDQNQGFVDVVLGADPATPVTTCPGWTLKQLFRHVGRGHRWAAQIIIDGTDVDPARVPNGKPPDDDDGARQWLLDGGQMLVDAAAVAGSGATAWTFIGPQPPSWWVRRRLHEALVHRADAAIAVGADFVPRPELAADAISEWLDIALARGVNLDGKSVHLHAHDEGLGERGEWTIADGSWSHAHGKGDVALRGPASDLLLATTRRVDIADTAVETIGDESVWRTWLDRTPF